MGRYEHRIRLAGRSPGARYHATVSFDRLDRTWEHLGATDALWAVLTHPDKRFGRWDEDEFFNVGQHEIDHVLGWVDSNLSRRGDSLARGRALDFGCGVGRATRALAQTFERVDGVDIAESMIHRAQQLNANVANAHFHLNKQPDLTLFEDGQFDFVYTALVLQHMDVQYQRSYIGEFLRLLRPGGVAAIEMATERVIGATSPLPDDAFNVELRAASNTLESAPRATIPVNVIVSNNSPHTLPAAGREGWYQVTVGNHWLDDQGKRIVDDDARAQLPEDIQSGHSVEVVLDVHAPAAPGRYKLELDCVQEAVAWFGDKGSPTTTVDVDVREPKGRRWFRSAPRQTGAQATEEAAMEMHGVPKDELQTWLTTAGGSIVADTSFTALLEKPTAPDWRQHIYLVRR